MSLFTDANLLYRTFGTHPRSLIYCVTNQAKLRFRLAYNSSDYFACVDADFKFELLASLQFDVVCNCKHFEGEVSHADREVVAKQSGIDFALHQFEPATSHVSFAHCLDFLETVLLAQLVEGVVSLI